MHFSKDITNEKREEVKNRMIELGYKIHSFTEECLEIDLTGLSEPHVQGIRRIIDNFNNGLGKRELLN